MDDNSCCCCGDTPGELVEAQTKGRDSAEHLETNVAGRLLAGAQNAAGIVLEALQEDGESDDGQKKPDTGGPSWLHFDTYQHHSHITVKVVGAVVAVALMVTSVLDMVGFLNPDHDFQLFDYVHNTWNLAFGLLMILMDAPGSWLGKLQSYQSALWQKAPFLARSRGRALVHFYVGCINLAMVDFTSFNLWTIIHLSRGGALVVCAVIMLLNHHTYHYQRRSHARTVGLHPQEVTKALDTFKEEALEVRTYIAKNHCSVRIVCFLIALALVATSCIGMLNVFGLLFSPFHYVVGVFNLFFAMLIALIDGEQSWFRKCCHCPQKLFELFPCLAELPGRSLLHFYVGSINVAMLPGMPLDVVYVALGGTLMLCSLLMLCHHNYCLHIPQLPQMAT